MTPGRYLSQSTPEYGECRVKVLALVLAGMVLAGMFAQGPLGHLAQAQQADSSLEYAENGTVPVAAFIAYDQDGDAIEWSLGGPDEDLFAIAGGVLTFREPPDYEDPRAAASGAPMPGGNTYRVTIEVEGGTHDVAVTVTDVDERGSVTLDRPQPQAGRPLSASLWDEDEGVTDERWQWARSEDGKTWTDIEGAISPRRSPEPADVDMYLRATANYSDKFGSGKTAAAVSVYRVEARTLSNAAPSFADQDEDESTAHIDVTRSVPENTPVGMNVGKTISATDGDDDVLIYELLDTPDLEDGDGAARFIIDRLSGQIRLGKELGADAGEREDEDSATLAGGPALPDGEDAGGAGNGEYVLRVRVSDPSTASATVNVVVRITDVNEPPRFDEGAPTVLRVRESESPPVITLEDGDTPLNVGTYAVTDEDGAFTGPQPYDDTSYTYSVIGADSDVLIFDGEGVLGFREGHEPDYEEQSSYTVTIEARSGEGPRRLTATLGVTVMVVDTEDAGQVFLSLRQPQVETAMHATLSDPDGGVSAGSWMWERSDEIAADEDGAPSAECRDDPGTPGIDAVGGWTRIVGASSAVYTPQAADVNRCLRATVIYSDNIGNPADAAGERAVAITEAPVQVRRPANDAPHFVDYAAGTSRRVDENTEAGQNIGAPVSAHDDDGDLPIYSLDGEDAASFDISWNSGQLKTRSALNYEDKSSYTVIVTATDPSGAAESIEVTIDVNDVDEPAQITGSSSVDFAENARGTVASFSAFDQDGDAVRWSLSGPDEGLFAFLGGVLRFWTRPDYEDPKTAVEGVPLAARNVYRVTIEARGGAHDLTVTVTNVDEVGAVTLDRRQPQVARPLSASLLDVDGGVTGERWQWARSNDGRTWTDIQGATSPRRSPAPTDVGMYLRATVTYTDTFGPDKTATAVSVYRVEARTLSNAAPSFAEQDEDEFTAYIDISRTVDENTAAGTAIGEPVSATDADEDMLLYELLDTPDLEDDDGHARFTIDGYSGQMRVGEELGADSGERRDEEWVAEDGASPAGDPPLPDHEDAGEPDNSEYVLRVRVSDPSTASDTVNVVVRVTDVDEDPYFDEDAPTLLRVRENESSPVITLEDGITPVDADTYEVFDQDEDAASYRPSVSGDDDDVLFFDSDGVLRFVDDHEPDYEEQRSYSITVGARPGGGLGGLPPLSQGPGGLALSGQGPGGLTSLDVTIEVVDGEDAGEVELSQRQVKVGNEVNATVSDPDGGVSIIRWVWERSDVVTVDEDGTPSAQCRDDPDTPGIDVVAGWTPIGGASSPVYAPQQADVGRCLRATAVYTDNIDFSDERATGVLEVAVLDRAGTDQTGEGGFVNAAPVFPDQELTVEGDQSDMTIRTVAENTKAGLSIGTPVSAHDDDGDLLIYTLGGADAGAFRISRDDGQLETRAPLDHETMSTYTVLVTATDPSGAADSIQVTINVSDVDEPAVITLRE